MSAFADFQTERPFARATAVEVNRSSTRKILTGGLGSITPTRDRDKLTLGPLSTAIGVAVSGRSSSGISAWRA